MESVVSSSTLPLPDSPHSFPRTMPDSSIRLDRWRAFITGGIVSKEDGDGGNDRANNGGRVAAVCGSASSAIINGGDGDGICATGDIENEDNDDDDDDAKSRIPRTYSTNNYGCIGGRVRYSHVDGVYGGNDLIGDERNDAMAGDASLIDGTEIAGRVSGDAGTANVNDSINRIFGQQLPPAQQLHSQVSLTPIVCLSVLAVIRTLLVPLKLPHEFWRHFVAIVLHVPTSVCVEGPVLETQNHGVLDGMEEDGSARDLTVRGEAEATDRAVRLKLSGRVERRIARRDFHQQSIRNNSVWCSGVVRYETEDIGVTEGRESMLANQHTQREPSEHEGRRVLDKGAREGGLEAEDSARVKYKE